MSRQTDLITDAVAADLSEIVRRRLAALPEFDPTPELGVRIARAHRARHARVPLWSAAAVVVLAVGAGTMWAVRPSSPASMPAGVSQFALLEEDVAQLRAQRTASADVSGLESELAQLDRALQRAYDSASSTEERARLWQQRESMLRNLRLAYTQSEAVQRI